MICFPLFHKDKSVKYEHLESFNPKRPEEAPSDPRTVVTFRCGQCGRLRQQELKGHLSRRTVFGAKRLEEQE